MPGLQLDKFLLFGDSITEFAYGQIPPKCNEPQFVFGAAMQNAYTRRMDVVQRGFSGYNSNWAAKILPKIIEIEHTNSVSKVRICTVFFGTNDAALGGPQMVELEKYLENVQGFIDVLKGNDIKAVFIGPGKHDGEQWGQVHPDDIAAGIIRTNENNLRYSEALKKKCLENDVAFADLYAAFERYEGDWRELLVDGIHFTGGGYKIMFDEVMKQVREKYPEFAPENVEYRLPYWRDYPAEEFEEKLVELLSK